MNAQQRELRILRRAKRSQAALKRESEEHSHKGKKNCERARDVGDAVEKFMNEDFAKEFPKKVVDWNWNHLNRFILWLFETE